MLKKRHSALTIRSPRLERGAAAGTRIVLIAIALAWIPLHLRAQETPPHPSLAADTDLALVTDFRPLFRERDDLTDKIRTLEQKIRDANDRIRNLKSAEMLQSDLDRAKADLTREQKATK